MTPPCSECSFAKSNVSFTQKSYSYVFCTASFHALILNTSSSQQHSFWFSFLHIGSGTTLDILCTEPCIFSSQLSGPFGGGTRLTITGTDLGVTVGDIANVTVGGVNCMVQPDGFKPGAQFLCVTGNYSYGEMPQTVPISVTMRSGSVATAQYTYVRPSISSVFPKSGPMAGGTNLIIEGMSLNVGNGVKRVLLNGAMCVIL